MRVPTVADWERWKRIREANDEREKREGTYCRVTRGTGPDYNAAYRRACELDQFERASAGVLLADETGGGTFLLMERPDGRGVFLARASGPRACRPRRY